MAEPKLALVVPLCGLFAASFAKLDNFFISETLFPWEESRAHCLSMGKVPLLLAFRDKGPISCGDAKRNGTGTTIKLMLLNLGKEISEGVWNWNSTGQPFYYTRWLVGQPDDSQNLNCFYLASKALFYWRDANCSGPMHFICENPADAWL